MKATVYVVGRNDGPGAGLTDLVTRLNFGTVQPYAGLLHAEQQATRTPICYFVFAEVPDVGALRGVAEAIRFSSSRRIRFSPLIYFSESASTETIGRCIDMGFDDVITMPFTRSRVMARINRQIGTSLIYFETPGYFGPDRRDRLPGAHRERQTRQRGQFRRMEIMRNLDTGVTVLRDDVFNPRHARQIAAA